MPKVLKQATLSSLKGVVVYEDILRHKVLLATENQSIEMLLRCLNYLAEKKPCREALLTTDIYSTVEKLLTHKHSEVVDKAKNIADSWKNVLNFNAADRKPLLDVRYDLETVHFRKTALQFFLSELGTTKNDQKLADALEKEIFHVSRRLVTGTYRRTTRKIVFVLRHNAKEKESLKRGDILPVEFVLKYQK